MTRAPVAVTVLVALLAQLTMPTFAQPAPGAQEVTARADSVARVPAVPAPAPAASLTREERHWIELVRACTANAKHLRLQLPGRIVETDRVAPEAAGVRFRAPHAFAGSHGISGERDVADTLVAWSDLSRVEVRNVATTGEGAATGAVVGLAIGLPVALVVALGAAMASLFTFKQEDSHAGEILLGAAALGLFVGANVAHPKNGGWVTCCERDTAAITRNAGTQP